MAMMMVCRSDKGALFSFLARVLGMHRMVAFLNIVVAIPFALLHSLYHGGIILLLDDTLQLSSMWAGDVILAHVLESSREFPELDSVNHPERALSTSSTRDLYSHCLIMLVRSS